MLLALLSTAPVFAQDIGQELKGISAGHLHLEPASPSPPPTLLVEIVDPVWLTVPGATVTLISRADRKKRYTATTDQDGIARFSVPKNAEYEIEAALTGFKKGRMKSVWLVAGVISESNGQTRPTPAPRVQMRLKLSGPSIVVE